MDTKQPKNFASHNHQEWQGAHIPDAVYVLEFADPYLKSGTTTLLFPAQGTTKPKPFNGWSKAKAQLDQKAGGAIGRCTTFGGLLPLVWWNEHLSAHRRAHPKSRLRFPFPHLLGLQQISFHARDSGCH
jgi:hypothetical protein